MAAVIHRGTEWGWKRVSLFSILVRKVFGRRSTIPKPPEKEPDLAWTSTSGFGGPFEVCFSQDRRVVRVVGQEFSLPPDDRTLIVLVHEGTDGPAAAQISTSVISVPARDGRPPYQHDHTVMARAMADWTRGNQQAWDAAVGADETVREFQRIARDHAKS